jgi:dipeptidyl aminopeptidase/acylaminoacyl peptidase
MSTYPNRITAQDVSSFSSIKDVVISPDGSKVVYTFSPLYRKADSKPTSAIWWAETGIGKDDNKSSNSKQLTSGLFNDTSLAIHPDGERIFFLSDRHDHSKGIKQIYNLRFDSGEPFPFTSVEKKREVEKFKISPCGKWIAYLSADEPSLQDEKNEEDKVSFLINKGIT